MKCSDEIRWFFATLVDHKCRVDSGSCATCLLLEKIYDLTLQMIFSVVVYPDVPIAARQQAAAMVQPSQGSNVCLS